MPTKKTTVPSTVPSTGSCILSHKKLASGAESWRVRMPDGRVRTFTSKASTVAAIDRTAKEFAGLLERLAKR